MKFKHIICFLGLLIFLNNLQAAGIDSKESVSGHQKKSKEFKKQSTSILSK